MDANGDATGGDAKPAVAGSHAPTAGLSPRRHRVGFIASGLLAFAVDSAVLLSSIQVLGANPLLAKIGAIWVAMLAGWLAHRRWTFALRSKPTVREFVHYATAGWFVVLINYGLFSFLLWMIAWMPPLVASAAASCGSMVFAYMAMRYSVFRQR